MSAQCLVGAPHCSHCEIDMRNLFNEKILTKNLPSFFANGINVSWAKSFHHLNLQQRAKDFFNGNDAFNLMQCLFECYALPHAPPNSAMDHNHDLIQCLCDLPLRYQVRSMLFCCSGGRRCHANHGLGHKQRKKTSSPSQEKACYLLGS